MRSIILLFLISCLSGCIENSSQTESPSSYVAVAYELRRNVAQQLKREKNLHPCGFGGGMMNKVRTLAISFNYYEEINVEEARELLVYAGNLFLKTINDDDRIRADLVNYPFLPNNIEIDIFLNHSDKPDFRHDKLQIVSITDGMLQYYTFKPNKHLDMIHTETFEEAAAKIKTVSL